MQQNSYIKRLLLTASCTLSLSVFNSVAQNSAENYVRTFTPLQHVTVGGVTTNNSLVTTTFFDTAGRRTQKVQEKVTSTGQDMADYVVYDSLGRVQQEWASLPFSPSSSPESRPLSDFVSSSYALGRHVDYTYEPSALARQTERSSVFSSGKSVVTEHICSVPANMYRFTLSDVGIIQNNGAVQYPMKGVRQTDEDGNTFTRYTDSRGRTMLERRGHTGSNETLDTYYVYDKLDKLACVLPPSAVNSMNAVGTYNVQTNTALQQYAYFYRYDTRNNCIGTKKPGIGWSYTVYDGDGRPVMSQTPNQQETHEWSFFRYDNLNRLCMKGTVMNTASPDSLVRQFRDVRLQDSCSGTGTYGYTESLSLGTDENVLNVYYYDNYNCLNLGIFSTLSGTDVQSSSRTRGLMTGSYTAPLTGSGYEVEVSLYDNRRRETASYTNNSVTGIRTNREYTLDYLGNPLTADISYACYNDSLSEHFAYTYDRLGRGTSATLDVHLMGHVNSAGYDLHLDLWTASYDELGRIYQTTSVGGYNATTRTYHNDGRLHQIQGPYYTQNMYYHNSPGIHKYYNGRISRLLDTYDEDTSVTDIVYDNFGRMEQAEASSPDGTFREEFEYDAMGNITHFSRSENHEPINDIDISYSGNRIASVQDYVNVTLINNLLYTPWSNEENAYLYDANGNETRNMSHNITQIKYNLLNLPDSVFFSGGNMFSFVYMADGRRVSTDSHTQSTPLVLPGTGGLPGPQTQTWERHDGDITSNVLGFTRLDIPGGYISLGAELYYGHFPRGYFSRQMTPYFYMTDYKESIVSVGNASTGDVEQCINYMPSGAVFCATSYAHQAYRYCGKEELTLHGYNMYDSFARYQYSRLPRFNTMDPLAEWDYATSPYAYCTNDFVNLVDPWGLDGWPGKMNYVDEAVVWGHQRGNKKQMDEFSEWCDKVNSYRKPLTGGFVGYQYYVDRYDPNLYGGGGSVSGDDWEVLAKIWKAENVGVSAIAYSLSSESLRTAELAYLITEKIDGNPITSNFIDWHASNLKYIKVTKGVTKFAGYLYLGYDIYEGYKADGDRIGTNTARNATTGGLSMIGGWAGAKYGAEIGASIGIWFDGVGAVPGAIIGGIIGGIVGGLAGESVGGMASDVLIK